MHVTRHDKTKRRERCGWFTTAISENNLLSFVMRIDLTESERCGIAVTPCDQEGVSEPRVFAGRVDGPCLLKKRPQKHAGITAGSLALARLEADINRYAWQRFQQSLVKD